MKMSQYGAITSSLATDEYIVRRGATTVKITHASLFSSINGSANPGFLSVVGGSTGANSLATSRSAAATSVQPVNTSGWLVTLTNNNGGNPGIQVVDQAGTTAGFLELMRFGGGVGIGMAPTALLELAADSAKKPSTNTWTVSSDERLKENILPADLERCVQIVMELPLKRFTWKEAAYSRDRVPDRAKLGWIAQDVQRVFPKAVGVTEFALQPVVDGVEDVLEPVMEKGEQARLEVIDGAAVLKVAQVDVPAFDELPMVDEHGDPVMVQRREEDGSIVTTQAIHVVPRMRTVQQPRMRTDKIEGCLSLNADQIYAAMYGALQAALMKIVTLERRVAELESARS